MNRKKKRNTILKHRLKKAKAKLAPKKKAQYVSKAKRAALDASEETLDENDSLAADKTDDAP